MTFDTIVRGGKVVTPAGVTEIDIGIEGEKIAALEAGLAEAPNGAKLVDASGHIVLPGVIDVHVHLELPFCGTVSSDDYRSGTRAGARGGVTTLMDFAIPYADESLSQAVDNWHRRAEGKAMIDYAFHLCITRWHEHRHQIKEMFERGITSFKEFMIYESEGWQSDDRALFCTLEQLRDLGGMLMVHAESSRVLDELIDRHHESEEMETFGARLHAITRPSFIEAEAIQRAIMWAEVTGGTLYVVHMSTGAGADLIKQAQARGVRVLSDDGEVAVISTDTCSFTREQKAMWEGDWTKIPMGLPGLETLLPVVYTHGTLEGRLSLEKTAERLSTNPAKIMGLYPKKGAIQVGADADIAIIHPEKTLTVDPNAMETNTDWSPFDGWELAGFARTTLSRGEVIVDDYQVVGREGRGQWLPRSSAGIPEGEL